MPFVIITQSFVNIAQQLSSHNFPIERRNPLCRLSRTCPVRSVVVNAVGRGSMAVCVAVMLFPLAAFTVGPSLTLMRFAQSGS